MGNQSQIGGDHYRTENAGAMQPWDAVHALGLDYYHGCAVKYLVRFAAKGGAQDLDKAVHYLRKREELELPAWGGPRLALEAWAKSLGEPRADMVRLAVMGNADALRTFLDSGAAPAKPWPQWDAAARRMSGWVLRANGELAKPWREVPAEGWARGLWLECAELAEALGWKWFADGRAPDRAAVLDEFADVLHYGLSLCALRGTEPKAERTRGAVPEGPLPAVDAMARAALERREFDARSLLRAAKAAGLELGWLERAVFRKSALNVYRQFCRNAGWPYAKTWPNGALDREDAYEYMGGFDVEDAGAFDDAVQACGAAHREACRNAGARIPPTPPEPPPKRGRGAPEQARNASKPFVCIENENA